MSTKSDELVELVGRLHSESNVPGFSVAAVKGDDVVLNQGFGVRSLASSLPVTPDTLFAIGSTTKAFTAAAIGGLVDDGLLDWDTPVREYMPSFRLADPVASDRVTPVDLLCHRSGVPSHDFVWIGFPERSRADLVARLRHLPASWDVRQAFQYFNLGYVALGQLIEAVTGQTWEEHVRARLFEPLGMRRTNTRISEMTKVADHSKGHELRGGSMTEVPFRVVDASGPAGSINSCSADMIAWLRAQIGSGASSAPVISDAARRKMQTPHITIGIDAIPNPEGVSVYVYGLGWMVGAYRGRRMVLHGGGIDGFGAQVMVLPDDGIGVAVLTNAHGGSLGPVAERVMDSLLGIEQPPTAPVAASSNGSAGPKPAETSAESHPSSNPARRLEDYVGEYEHPAYGAFSIAISDGWLVPSFGTLRLELTHSHADVFDLEWQELSDSVNIFPLSFHVDPEGDVVALSVPFEAAVDPIRFERLPDPRPLDPEFLQSLTGTYANGSAQLVIELQGKELTASLSGGPGIELAPDRGLRFVRKPHPMRQGQGIFPPGPRSFEFVLTSSGSVESLHIRPLGVFSPTPVPQEANR